MKKRGTSSDIGYQLDQIDLYHGDVKLYRTPSSGNRWYFKYWDIKNQKYFRKSLRTRDEELARSKADKLYEEIKSKIKNGFPVFSITFHKVIDEYVEEIRLGVGADRTLERYKTIVSQSKWIKKFKPDPALKIEDLETDSFIGYFSFRRMEKSNVVNATLKHEQATINGIIRYAVKKKYLAPTFQLEFPTNLKAKANPRPAISRNQYARITRYFRTNEYIKNDDSICTRKFIRDFVLVLANSGMRFGEARRLKYENVKLTKSKDGSRLIAVISLNAEQTKNGTARVVQARNGEVYKRIKSYSKYTKSNDLIFVNNESGNGIKKDIYYKIWNLMLRETGLEKERPKISYYGLRHMYVTLSLLKNIPHKVIAQNVGTGLQYIDKHYGQTNTEMFREQLTGDLPSTNKWLWDDEEW